MSLRPQAGTLSIATIIIGSLILTAVIVLLSFFFERAAGKHPGSNPWVGKTLFLVDGYLLREGEEYLIFSRDGGVSWQVTARSEPAPDPKTPRYIPAEEAPILPLGNLFPETESRPFVWHRLIVHTVSHGPIGSGDKKGRQMLSNCGFEARYFR